MEILIVIVSVGLLIGAGIWITRIRRDLQAKNRLETSVIQLKVMRELLMPSSPYQYHQLENTGVRLINQTFYQEYTKMYFDGIPLSGYKANSHVWQIELNKDLGLALDCVLERVREAVLKGQPTRFFRQLVTIPWPRRSDGRAFFPDLSDSGDKGEGIRRIASNSELLEAAHKSHNDFAGKIMNVIIRFLLYGQHWYMSDYDATVSRVNSKRYCLRISDGSYQYLLRELTTAFQARHNWENQSNDKGVDFLLELFILHYLSEIVEFDK